MANTIIVATFNNTNAAYDAASEMKKLMDQKVVDFKPKAGVMIKKDDLGNTTAGVGSDSVLAALDADFVDSVRSEMRPGMTAIIVEADEKSTKPVDDIVTRGRGQVRRQAA
jgi:hypothetical protein